MKKLFIALLLPAMLYGCAATSVPLASTAKSEGSFAAGTLALVGTCEMDVAADYTALIMYRHRAARAVTRGAITVDQARRVQTLADSARADLDAACPNAAATLDIGRRDAARATLKTIASILEKKP